MRYNPDNAERDLYRRQLAAPTSDFSGTINWGDGKHDQLHQRRCPGSNGTFTVNGSHHYAEAGTYAPVVTINDDGGSTTTDTGTTSVSPCSPTLTTTPNAAAVTLGANAVTLTDMADLASGYNETGTITFKLYYDGGTTPVDTETVTVTGNGSYSTPNGYTLPTNGAVIGTYQWDASYSGDSNNNAASDNNNFNEHVTVSAASPTVTTTQQPASVTVGSAIADQATVSGGYSPTGTVTFNLYDSATTQNSSTLVFSNTETVGNNGVATSANYTTTATGTDYLGRHVQRQFQQRLRQFHRHR